MDNGRVTMDNDLAFGLKLSAFCLSPTFMPSSSGAPVLALHAGAMFSQMSKVLLKSPISFRRIIILGHENNSLATDFLAFPLLFIGSDAVGAR